MSEFANINDLAAHLRQKLEDPELNKKYLLLFAYNGVGKTRLSVAFKNEGKQNGSGDTLYFNAFTEDLFNWDNDLDGDSQRLLKINSKSRFFAGLEQLEMENRIRPFLHRYADFYFEIDYKNWNVIFSREIPNPAYDDNNENLEEERTITVTNIKISRGEENLFIWCFFLAIVQLALDGDEAYQWVSYIYIDDPISSLDENNAIKIAHHLSQLIRRNDHSIKTVISSHHTLFFNVMWNELRGKKLSPYFLSFSDKINRYSLRYTEDTPFFHHVATLIELHQAAQEGVLYTYHFSILRTILEKSASFHGYTKFSALIAQEEDDPDGILYSRLINILNHGNYSLYEPREMLEENKVEFKKILDTFLENYPFNPELFPQTQQEQEAALP
jgi:3-phenylpropionate/cinnamic acid dioxygenase small subunit